jgi:hypothetical protein
VSAPEHSEPHSAIVGGAAPGAVGAAIRDLRTDWWTSGWLRSSICPVCCPGFAFGCQETLRRNWREGARNSDGVRFACAHPSPSHYPFQWYRDSGYSEATAALSTRLGEAVAAAGLREYYDPYTGRGMGASDFGWSSLILEMLYPGPRAHASVLGAS